MKSILKKILIVTVALIASLNLCSCNLYQFDEEKVGKDMESVLTQLFNSVQDGDKEKFKTFFADHIVALPDFENGCNYVFDIYQGRVISVKCDYPMGTGKHIVPGEQICYAFQTFDIITNGNSYTVYVEFYTNYQSKYPNDPYKIRIFKLLNKQQLEDGETFHDCSLRYGIYYPGWPVPEVD